MPTTGETLGIGFAAPMPHEHVSVPDETGQAVLVIFRLTCVVGFDRDEAANNFDIPWPRGLQMNDAEMLPYFLT